ncbi:hypothetical protein BDV18DRAFT_45482 [Aspergillus unguis]
MLTPIRTRGRRKSPPTPNDEAPQPVPSGPKGGRPMLAPGAKRAGSQAASNKRARLVTKPPPKPRRRLSRLESLPVELIEKIFLYSMNINLPRCSDSIAATVSSERIYRVLMLLAFFDNDSARLVMSDSDSPGTPEMETISDPRSTAKKASERQISRLLKPVEYYPFWEKERRSLQASVVSCRWCTPERMMSVLPDLMRLTIWQRWLSWAINMPRDQQASLHTLLAQKHDPFDPTLNDSYGALEFENEGGPNARHVLSVDPLVSISIRQEGYGSSRETNRIIPLFSVLEIPDKFVSGGDEGFNAIHTRFLESLRVAGGLTPERGPELRKEINLSREAIQEGIHTALIEQNETALMNLLLLDEYTFRCQNHRHHLLYMIPAEHFRTAVRMARDDPGIFQLLLRASAESVPSDDSEITQWAIGLNNPFGPWLLDFMLQLPERLKKAQRKPCKRSFFLYGKHRRLRDPMAKRYHFEVEGLVIPPEQLEERDETNDSSDEES